jgi:hypothetical protein
LGVDAGGTEERADPRLPGRSRGQAPPLLPLPSEKGTALRVLKSFA